MLEEQSEAILGCGRGRKERRGRGVVVRGHGVGEEAVGRALDS